MWNQQPARNLALNPTFETAQGTVNVRTNLVIAPGFEVSSGVNTLRTNYAYSPRQSNINLGTYNGVGTIATVAGIGSQPDGITTAVRTSYSAGAANYGVKVMILPDINTVYTFSAWVFNEGAVSETIALALNGASSGGSQVVAPGVWTKLVWTYTTPGSLGSGNDFGVRIAVAAGTGSFLTTGVVIEKAAGLSQGFFDGSSTNTADITYAWVGSPQQGASTEKAPNAQYWSAASTAAMYQNSISAPFTGTKSGAVYTRGFSGDGVYVTDIPVVVGTGYTFSAYIKLTTSVPNFSLVIRWKDSGNGTISDSVLDASGSLTVGTFGRISATAIAPAGAVNAQPMLRIMAAHTQTLFYIDAVMFELSPVLLSPYFDGATAASGDFTYAWSGTANQSTSYQRAPGVANMQTNYYSAAIQSSEWSTSGAKSLRIVPNSAINESFAGFVGNFGTLGPLQQGKTYTAMANLRLAAPLSGGLNGRNLQMVYREDTVRIAQVQGANVAGVQPLRFKFTVGASAASGIIELFNGASAGNGDVWWDNLMVVEGDYTGDYVDGAKPFSKWDGAADASASVGYPQWLYQLAGAPDVDLEGVATTGGVAIPVSPYAARTFYVVYEVTGNTTAYQSAFYHGIAGSKGFMLQTAVGGSSGMAHRYDFVGGSTNGPIVHSNGRSLFRRHVAAFTFASGLTSALSCVNGQTDVSTTGINPGSGWDDGRAQTLSSSELKPVRALVYYAEHDRATRVAISRYLGNKYGASVA